jgi:TetR/AcrR family transcriptional repressor of nem operon
MRAEISDAALERFHSRGYSAAGVKDITDAAGVPKGSFYNHFASKEAMGVEALHRYAATQGFAVLADDSLPPVERIRRHFTFLRAQQEEHGYTRGCLYGNFAAEVADHSDVLRAAVAAGLDGWARLVATAIEQAQRDGSVRAGLDPAVTARFVLNAFEGALLGARAARSPESFDAFFTTVFGVLLTAQ